MKPHTYISAWIVWLPLRSWTIKSPTVKLSSGSSIGAERFQSSRRRKRKIKKSTREGKGASKNTLTQDRSSTFSLSLSKELKIDTWFEVAAPVFGCWHWWGGLEVDMKDITGAVLKCEAYAFDHSVALILGSLNGVVAHLLFEPALIEMIKKRERMSIVLGTKTNK